MSIYFEMIRAQANKAVNKNVSTPNPSLAVGDGETLAPVTLRIPQQPVTAQRKPVKEPIMHRDQSDYYKLFTPLNDDTDSMPILDGGVL